MTTNTSPTSSHEAFVASLLAWFDADALELPWRGTDDPYHIWLSEIMLQQTQIDTVRPYYRRFLENYPTLSDLARASLADVLKLWEGLGYYSRARRLHQTAQRICHDYGGQFPQTVPELMRLPGIGRYTAGAIASIAFDVPVPVLDGNVQRVLTRLQDIAEDVSQPATQKMLWRIAGEYTPAQRPGDYNQALMELGQRVCTPRQPGCTICPVANFCLARARGTQQARPVKPRRTPTPHHHVAAGIIRDEEGRILIAQRLPKGLLAGLWEFPGGKQEGDETLPQTLQRELREELAIEVEVLEHVISVKHAFTHMRITLHAYACRYLGATPPYTRPQNLEVASWAWIKDDEFDRYAFGKADRLVIAHLAESARRLL